VSVVEFKSHISDALSEINDTTSAAILSNIVAVTLYSGENATKLHQLDKPVALAFPHSSWVNESIAQPKQFIFRCVFWDFETSDWSSEGCKARTTFDLTVCECDHLTNFAVILDINPDFDPGKGFTKIDERCCVAIA
jgi:hypothetical protein